MKTFVIMIVGALTLGLYSCKDDDAERIEDPIGDQAVELNYNFDSSDEGWDAGIVGILADEEDLYGFEVEQTTAPFDDEEGVLLLSASNPNSNLFMYASKQVTGLEPNTRYDVNFDIAFASDVVVDTTGFDVDTVGIVGDTTGVVTDTTDFFASASDTVNIKVGVASEEPVTETDGNNFLQLIGIDIGEPGVDGADLVVIGSYRGNGADNGYQLQTASTDTPISAMTNEDGDLWLIVGAETTGTRAEIYISNIDVEISK